jgi:HK97 family phage portal protein
VFLVRDPFGEVVDVIVLDPSMVSVSRGRTGIEYRVQSKLIDPLEIMHVKGMTLPGQITGLSPIGYARESIGLGLATQRYGAGFFENGALPGAVVTAPGKFSDDAAKLFASTWNDNHQGIGNAHKVGVLTEGATLNKVSVTPEDAQFLETRRFQVPDIARIYGVPPHLIADAERSTSWGSGLAEQNMSFGQYTLRPLCERIEEGHTSLMPSMGLPDVFVKLNLDALLRAALKERYDSYAVAIAAEFMVPNEARKLEDLPPLPGGDVVKPPVAASSTPEPQTKSTFGGGA